jgi:acetyl-CoA carboxylase biotin carboxylase subunit
VIRYTPHVFRRLLVANRGEIAARILRACRDLSIETVAVYSEADRGAPWLEGATLSVCVGPAKASASYLDQDAVLQAAEQTEARAIHPGYGFLSENAVFAARCAHQGIAFIGPGPAAIRRMGDKLEAKRTMAAAGVPTIPGSLDALESAEHAASLARDTGYPVLLKAAAGGGGKGMRRCDGARALARAFSEATLEAEHAFGDPRLYLEAYLEGGRHIEFQVLADASGRAIHLGERECSVQRHHQKLLEEAGSPVITERERAELGAKAAAAAASFGYVSAGTLEFLRTADGRLVFMEMNTRLQVEHPVTEMVTGVDIVREQIAIAANRPLSRTQEEIVLRGHAIELRINAEDPDAGFAPDPGTITAVTIPASPGGGVTIRWDGGIAPGWRVPPHYDSMVGKLVVHAPDRRAAIEAARAALAALTIEGIKTTIPLHRRILEDPDFVAGTYDVSFLERKALAAAPRG